MNKFLIAAFAVLALTAWKHSDVGDPLESQCRPDGLIPAFSLSIRPPEKIEKLYAAVAVSAFDTEGKRALAFTAKGPHGEVILILPPLRGQNDQERLAIWGHELAHLVCGAYHGRHSPR